MRILRTVDRKGIAHGVRHPGWQRGEAPETRTVCGQKLSTPPKLGSRFEHGEPRACRSCVVHLSRRLDQRIGPRERR